MLNHAPSRGVIVFFALALAFAAAAPARPVLPPGQYSQPIYAKDGATALVYKAEDARIRLRILDAAGGSDDRPIPGLGGDVFSPGLAMDRAGGLWVFGEEWSPRQSGVFLGRLDRKTADFKSAFRRDTGLNRSPDVAFDAMNTPWLGWTDGKGDGERVCVAAITAGRSWTVAAGPGLVVARVRLLADAAGHVWLFWAGAYKKERGVYFSEFDGTAWSAPAKAGGRGDFPCLDPEPAVDGQGRLWLLWSGYDGERYGIDYAVRNGRSWSATRGIPGVPGEASRSPRLVFLYGTEPVAVWDETRGRDHRTMASVFQNNDWTGPEAVGISGGQGEYSKIAAAGDRIAIIGREGPAIVSSFLTFAQVKFGTVPKAFSTGLKSNRGGKSRPAILFNPLLSESGYIGFGDSITYGYMDYEEAPDKGYPPRLQILLNQAFGTTTVFNDGIGGETTPYGATRIDRVISSRQARYILIMEGTNDVKLLEIPIDTTLFDFKEMLRKCLAAGVFPAISTILPRRDWIAYYTLYTDRFDEVNLNIPLIAAEKGVPMLDLFKVFDEYPDGGPDALLSTDLVHPNEKGYQVMADHWYSAIRAFPFPPAQIQVRKDTDKILFYRKPGNVLSWVTNPKIADASIISRVKLFRRKRGEGTAQFILLATVSGVSTYFDDAIDSGTTYEYILVSVRNDGIEGPASDPVTI